MEITNNAGFCVVFCGRLHLGDASRRFTGFLLQPWICSVFKRASQQLCYDYPLLCHDWILLCPSTCHYNIQLEENLEKNSGAQRGIRACSSTSKRRYDSLQAWDSFKQIFVCCSFCLHVVLGTFVDHHHHNALQRRWNDATKCSTPVHFPHKFVQYLESFHLRRNESNV